MSRTRRQTVCARRQASFGGQEDVRITPAAGLYAADIKPVAVMPVAGLGAADLNEKFVKRAVALRMADK